MELIELKKRTWQEGTGKNVRKENLALCDGYLELVSRATSLSELFDLHKAIWRSGVRNHKSYGPNEYGMFRCDDISTMKMDDVFLGNIAGLWTYRLPYWENMRTGESDTVYNTVLNQYRFQLSSGIEAIRSKIYDNGINRKSLLDYINRKYNIVARVIDKSIGLNKLCDLEFVSEGRSMQTKMFVMVNDCSKRVFLPEDFLLGQNPSNGRQVKNTVWVDVNTGTRHLLKNTFFSGLKLVDAPQKTPAKRLYVDICSSAKENTIGPKL